MAVRELSLSEMVRRCRAIEAQVRQDRLASEEELAAYQPGGPSNPLSDRSLWSWVRYYAQLARFMGRGESRASSGGAGASAEAQILEALRAEPAEVQLTARDAEGLPRKVMVFPKSFSALLWLHGKHLLLARLNGWVGALDEGLRGGEAAAQGAEPSAAKDLELLERGLQAIDQQYARIAWAISHPAAGLPFSGYEDPMPEPPSWTRDLEPWDYLRLNAAFRLVNYARLEALSSLLDPRPADEEDEEGQRPSWSVFIATQAGRMGVPAKAAMDDISLAEILASATLTARRPVPSAEW